MSTCPDCEKPFGDGKGGCRSSLSALGLIDCLNTALTLLRQKLSTVEAKLVEAERENKAWRALAGNRVAGYGSEMSARGEEGTDSFEYVFGAESRGTGNWYEVSSGSKQNAAIYLATELGLLDKDGG